MKIYDEYNKQTTFDPLFTLYSSKENKTITDLVQEIESKGIKLHFELFDLRLHLTLEVQKPPKEYRYKQLLYKNQDISKHNTCRTTNYGPEKLWGNEFHQIETRFWAPRVLAVLKHPEYFSAKYVQDKD